MSGDLAKLRLVTEGTFEHREAPRHRDDVQRCSRGVAAELAALGAGRQRILDEFMTISELDAANFRCGNAYDVKRGDDAVPIQITVFVSRTAEQKRALYRRIADLLGENPGIRPEDVFVDVLDAPKENWSVGHGLAQFA